MPLNHSDVSMFRNEREALRFYASPGVVWFIPLIVALTAGILIGILAGLVAWRFFGDTSPFVTFAITAVTVTLLVWLRVTIWALSKIDLIPNKTAGPVEINLRTNDDKQLIPVDLKSVTPDQFSKIVKMINNGGDLAIDTLKPFFQGSRPAVNTFRLELRRWKLAEWVDPTDHRSGMQLTENGEDLFSDYNHSPTSEVNNARE